MVKHSVTIWCDGCIFLNMCCRKTLFFYPADWSQEGFKEILFFIRSFQLQTETFHNLVESEEDYDSKSVTAMGILETIEIIVGELDGAPEVSFKTLFKLNLTVCSFPSSLFDMHVKIFFYFVGILLLMRL